ncbi:MAG: DUF1080 domain-containing protein [Dehalococcoidales bacterium]|nr:DUF1080 domain-containing protein [Dehalococcoidales bacterium]
MKKCLITDILIILLLLPGCTRPIAETPAPDSSETPSSPPVSLPTQPPVKPADTPSSGGIDTSIVWESMQGPPGGWMDVLIQNPYKHNELFTVTQQKNLYKSEDKGENWRLITGLEHTNIQSIAITEDRLFLCGNGLHYLDGNEKPIQVLDSWWNKVIVSDGKIFVTRNGVTTDEVVLQHVDLGTGDFNWQDISPTASELSDLSLPPASTALWRHVDVTHIVALGDRLLASITASVEGSGELTNGDLYISEDLGRSWSKVELDVSEELIIANLVQNPADPEHIFVLFKHPIMGEFQYPVSQMVRDSHDGGRTWNKVTDLTIESNGISDIAIDGSVYYLASPSEDSILKLDASGYERIFAPVEEFSPDMRMKVSELIIDPDNPDIVYAHSCLSWGLGLIKSEDGMKTWRKMDGDIVASSPTIVIAHPADPETVFSTGNTIQESYVTRDGGKTWEPFSPTYSDDEVRVDPHNPGHILLIDEMTNIYESYDSGRTWEQINTGFTSAKVFDFEVSQENPDDIYVSNLGLGISKYTGNNWQYLINSPDYAYDIELDPKDNSIIYASYSPKIFEDFSSLWRYSPNQQEGFGWSEILRVEDSGGITSIAFDPVNPDNIYAGVIGDRGAIYASKDRGESWRVLNEHFTMCTVWGQSQLVIHPDNPSIAYAATWLGGTWKTEDAGQTWTLLEEAPISSTALGLNEEDTDIIYLADRSSPTVWKSEDAGQTWREVANFRADGALLVMRVLADGDTVYASTFNPALGGGKLYRSVDAGDTWADITGSLPKGILDIAVDPTNPKNVYVTTNINGVYKSTDGGNSWAEIDSHPYVGVYDIEVDPIEPAILYTAARGGSLPAWFTEISGDFPDGIVFEDSAGVYKSTDAGATWSKVLATTASCRAVRLHPEDHNVLFAADLVDGLQMSTDGGETWQSLNSGLDTTVLTSCAVGGDKIYVGTQGCGVYSGDFDVDTKSLTWQPDRSNKPIPAVYNLKIEVDPANSNNIYITSYPGGMFASTDSGRTFKDRNAITPSSVVDYPLQEGYYALAVNPNDPSNMWIGTWGKGIYKSYDSMVLNVPVGLFGKHIRQVIIDPVDPDTVYVATKEGVFVTRDEGITWEEINDGLQTLDITSLRIISPGLEPFTDDFEDGNADGWQLDDGWSVIQDDGNYVLEGIGHKWANTGLDSWQDYTFETRIKPADFGSGVHINFRRSSEGRYFLALYQNGLHLSKQFNQWQEFAHGLSESPGTYSVNRWYDLKVEARGANIKVYVDGVLKINYTDPEPLLNGAIAFETLDNAHYYVDDIKVSLDRADIQLYASTAGYGIYRFNSSASQWQNLGRTLGSGWWSPWERRMYQFSSLLFAPDVPGKVYLGHFPGGFFVSEDNGYNWIDSSLGLGNDGIFSLTMHPHDHNVLFAGTYNGVVKSVDGGHTWEMISNGMPPEQWPYTVAIDDTDPDIMYTSTKNGQNKGFAHRNDFCGVVMKSVDGGENWFNIMNGLDEKSEFYTLIIYPLDHDILFLSTNKGFYISRDAGESWQAANTGLPSTDNQVRDNVAENLALTADNKYLLLGLVNYGVWKADLSGIESRP